FLYLEAKSLARCERTVGELFDLIVTNSAVDEAVIRKLSPFAKTATIPNGVDTMFFAPNGGRQEPHKLVFTGVMNYRPNEDAANFFCDAILPVIRRHIPAAEFWIVGQHPTPSVRALSRRP